MSQNKLRRGSIVEVKSPAEILATLDSTGSLGGLPFMSEMLQYCGRRFTVYKRTDKICDMIYPLASRELPDTVLLEDLRCDGSGHDGCQAECRIFWKAAWLREVQVPNEALRRDGLLQTNEPELDTLLARAAKEFSETDSQMVYRCQATEQHRASLPLSRWDPRPLVREFLTGNVSFGTFIRVSLRAAIQEPLRVLGLRSQPPLRGASAGGSKSERLGLQPGQNVVVKSREEIAATLSQKGFNRGLWFDEEMLPYCGGIYRVRQRIRKFIDEHTGRMISLKSDDCVSLDGVVCSGQHSPVRWFCPRGSYPFWRESWLRPLDQRHPDAPAAADGSSETVEPPTEAVFHHPLPPLERLH
jgi:hypothetical protein